MRDDLADKRGRVCHHVAILGWAKKQVNEARWITGLFDTPESPKGDLASRPAPINGMSRFFGSERLLPMKKTLQHLIAEVPRSASKVEMTIGIDLGDVWSHYCTLNEAGEVVERGRF